MVIFASLRGSMCASGDDKRRNYTHGVTDKPQGGVDRTDGDTRRYGKFEVGEGIAVESNSEVGEAIYIMCTHPT